MTDSAATGPEAEDQKVLRYLKKVTAELQRTRERLRAVETAGAEPIAVVATGCRFAGGIDSPEALWDTVMRGEDVIGDFPHDRGWDLDAVYDPDPDSSGTSYVRRGCFIDSVGEFDPAHFGISPREAELMDPQQRLLLEVSWEALERGGIAPGSLRGGQVGVYVGTNGQDYRGLLDRIPAERDSALGTGTLAAVISGRISYVLGLEGPAVTVDTACSSALVGMHLAATALRNRECSLALAGGATVMTTPDSFIAFSRQRGLAIDGRCKAFSDDADGTGWGEGVGMIVLERLSDAQRNGHPVLAVLAGSAINSDGASNGLTAPNGPSQQRVIRSALTAAGLSGADVDVLEAHGTGTTLGDPIEAQALMATYGRTRGPGGPLLLGSVKSNIGHTQAAAGAAGVIKMVTALGKGIVPPTLHASEPSTTIDWTSGAVELVTETTEWPAVERVRRAGVSSFGASGTNAHVILEQAPAPEPRVERVPGPLGAVRLPLLVSGRTDAARDEHARSITALSENSEHDDIAAALALTRTHLRHRAAIVGRTPADTVRGLEDTSDTEVAVLGIAGDRTEPVFVFPGQGSQWRSMATELIMTSPVFAERMNECARACGAYVEWDLIEELSGPQERVDVVQPLLWAVMVSLAHTWQACGVSPAAVIGHSQGEIAAAVVAGALSLDDGARVVTLRSRAIAQELAGRGGMMSIGESAETVRGRLTTHPELSIAAINGARSVVVSGDVAALDALTEELVAAADVRIKRLPVDYASHSAHVDSLRETLDDVLSGLSPRSSEIPFYSTVTGEPIDTVVLDADYWFTNLRGTVRFGETVERVIADGFGLFVESSPHPVLTVGIAETADSTDSPAVATIPSLRRDDGGADRFVASLAEAHVHGAAVDWATVMGTGLAPVALPTYPFQRETYWPDAGWAVGDVRSAGVDATGHRLLGGAVVHADGGGAVFTGRLSTVTHPWLADHALGDVVIFPGTGHLELVAAAAERLGCGVVEDLTLGAPLIIPDAAAVGIQVVFGAADDSGRRTVAVYSTDADADPDARSWHTHATGTVGVAEAFTGHRLDAWPPAGAEAIDVEDLYAGYAEANLHYGPAFRALTAAWRVGDDVYATVNSVVDVEGVDLHPAVSDAALHAIGLTSVAGDDALLPFSWSYVRVHAVGARDVRVRVRPLSDTSVSVDIADASGAPVASVGELVVRAVAADALPDRRKAAGDLYRVVETPLAVGDTDARAVSTVIRSEKGSTAAEVEAALVDLLTELQQALNSDADMVAVVVPDDPAGAAAAGLVRAAAAEEPDRIVLVTGTGDVDGAVAHAVAAGEPHVVLRGSEVFTPRLVRVDDPVAERGLRTDGTVLITGASGVLAGELARHLVLETGIRHLTLLSRSAVEQPLIDDLIAAGAEVAQIRCDVTDRAALSTALDGLPADRPLRAVIHTAGVLADGTFGALTEERLGTVLAPKVHGAWHLHDLTRDHELDAFVMFSSTAGVLGAPGQANYSAANAYLDALAELRRSAGLPALSLAWGLWAQGSGMTDSMDGTDHTRLTRGGITPLATADAFALFDRGLRSPDLAAVVAADFDLAGMRARGERPDPAFRALVTVRRVSAAAQAVDDNAWRAELSAADPAQRERMVTDLVRERVASILGHRSVDGVPADRPFKELGFDSLAAVELRNALSTATGLRLPATLVFDHPTPVVLARRLIGDLGDSVTSTPSAHAVHGSDEPIAVVGMACRYPGGVESPDDLWDLVASGRDVVTDFPDDRGWDLERLYDPTLDRPGTSYSRQGSFLDGAGDFDAELFGIDPLEANALDPQVRQLLETSRTALEHAGIDPTSLAGTDTGTYVGLMYHDYAGAYGTGSVVSGRVAYELGLEGPTMTVDTACSSSLVALHLAAQAIRAGECRVALAGGVTVMATPGIFVEFSRQRGLSPDGRCRSFADSANGTGFSEGVGVLVLERLSEAKRHGRNILAVLRGSAVNQDGASNGPTAPNGPAQQRVIRLALDSAGLTTADVDVVEAHGTGTTLGDPIEAQALIDTYGRGRSDENPVWLGSIKSNIGHAQAAAGVAGVIKMIQALRHRSIPATLHVDGTPSRHIDWEGSGVALLTEDREWPERDRPLRAAVSSFGLSGTNAHVVLEAAPAAVEPTDSQARIPIPWLLSGTSEGSLREQAASLLDWLERNQNVDAVATARTLATGRAMLGHRAALVGSDVSELHAALTGLVAGDASADALTGTARDGRTAFLFAGQGAQRQGMGSEAAAAHGEFERAFAEVCSHADPLLETPLREAIASAELVGLTEYTQPALFAVQVASYRWLASVGVRPDVLVGHSIGEIAAAHVAGVLDLPSAVRLVCARGRLMQRLPEGGSMVAIGAPVDEVRPYLTSEVGLAAINGPAAVVVSGTEAAVDAIAGRFERTTRLRVSHAFHSPSMAPMIDEFRTVVEALEFRSPTIPIVSTVTGEPVTDEMTDPEYWIRHVTGTVRFADTVNRLSDSNIGRMVEIGPGSTLSSLAAACVAESPVPPETIPTMRSGRAEPEALSVALARIHVTGGTVDWAALVGSGTSADLPTYVYSHRRYWINSDVVEHDRSAHPILGGAVEIAGTGTTLYSNEISVATHPWLADHRMGSAVVVPGTVFAEIATATGMSVGASVVRELTVTTPLVLPATGSRTLQASVGDVDGEGLRELRIHSAERSGGEWTLHASATLADDPATATEPDESEWPPHDDDAHDVTAVDVDALYSAASDAGVEYGRTFRGLTAVSVRGDDVFAEVTADALTAGGATGTGYVLHPAVLDAILQPVTARRGATQSVVMPFSWSGIRIAPSRSAALRVRISETGSDSVRVTAVDDRGVRVVDIESLTLREISVRRFSALGVADGLSVIDRLPLRSDDTPTASHWTVLTTDPEQAAALGGEVATVRTAVDIADAASVPTDVVVIPVGTDDSALDARAGSAARRRLHDVAEHIRGWASEPALAASTLVVSTSGPADSAVKGLVRSAASENAGAIVLVDIEAGVDSDSVWRTLPAALATGEPEVAVGVDGISAPRLTAAPAVDDNSQPWPDTVLVTGGTGAVGSTVALHLVRTHGVGHVILLSRRGPDADGASGLVADIEAAGGRAVVVAGDIADETAVRAVFDAYPIRGVVHAAGVLDDGLLADMTDDRFDAVARPKIDAALTLHALSLDHAVEKFVLFSSTAGILGSPGQSNYAAANTFLDALAEHRHTLGLPATSLVWGRWSGGGGMADRLDDSASRRMSESGIIGMSDEDALALFDAAVDRGDAVVVPARFDISGLTARFDASPTSVPPVLRGLLRRTRSTAAPTDRGAELRASLADLTDSEQGELVDALVHDHTSAVLGVADVDMDAAFGDLGFDSLAAVEFRNRLVDATGLRLPATVVFDHPNPAVLARHLLAELAPAPAVRHAVQPDENAESASVSDEDIDALDTESLISRALGATDDGDPTAE